MGYYSVPVASPLRLSDELLQTLTSIIVQNKKVYVAQQQQKESEKKLINNNLLFLKRNLYSGTVRIINC